MVGRSIFVFVHFFFFCLPVHAFSQLGSSNLASPIFFFLSAFFGVEVPKAHIGTNPCNLGRIITQILASVYLSIKWAHQTSPALHHPTIFCASLPSRSIPGQREKLCTDLPHGVEKCFPSSPGECGGEWWRGRLDGGRGWPFVEVSGRNSS